MNDQPIPNIFKSDQLPPLFSNTFRELGPEWEKLTGVGFDAIGRILTCHLIAEHYLTKFIELHTPKEFDWDNSRLSFAQKLKITSKTILIEGRILRGLEILNKIRNRYSHNLNADINATDITELKSIVVELSEKVGVEKPFSNVFEYKEYSDIAVIEFFTSLACAFIAGYCTATWEKEK